MKGWLVVKKGVLSQHQTRVWFFHLPQPQLQSNPSSLLNLNKNKHQRILPHSKPNHPPIHNMSSNDNTSSLQAAIDSVTGTVQSAIGSLTGSTGDQVKGDAKQDKAQAEHDASHASVKVPGATVSASGVAKDDPDRAAGSWNQTVGSAKEAVGGLVGSEVSSSLFFCSSVLRPLHAGTERYTNVIATSLSRTPAASRTSRVRSRRPRASSLTSAPVLPTVSVAPSAVLLPA